MSLGKQLGSTQTGADWCLKALHPSDPLTEVRGIPDKSAVPSLLMNYQATLTVGATAGSTGTWSFDASLLPHPINFMVVDVKDSTLPAGAYSCLLNPQLDGDTHSEKFATLLAMAQRWRLAYMSVTAVQNGSSMVNQGVIVAAQVPVQCRRFQGYGWYNNTISLNPAVAQYSLSDLPVFEELQAMPSAYFNRSKEGCYMPMKLTDTCQKWSSEHNQCGIVSETIAMNATGQVIVPNTDNYAWPHETLTPARCDGATSGGAGLRVYPTSAMLNGVFAHICGKGIDVATSFTFYVRCGIEMQVQPSSVLAPQLKLSPPHDPLALETYFAVCRELKDGYPEVYNSKGQLWPLIQNVVHKVAPAVVGALAPTFSPFVGGALQVFDKIGDGAFERIQARRERKATAQQKVEVPRNLAESPKVRIKVPSGSSAGKKRTARPIRVRSYRR